MKNIFSFQTNLLAFARFISISFFLASQTTYAKQSQQDLMERLFDAASSGRIAEVRELIPKVGDINASMDWHGRGKTTALIVAAKSTQPNHEVLDILIRSGANLDAQSEDGDTALTSAVLSGNLENLRILLKAGANPNIVGRYGETAIMIAANLGKPEFVQMLADAGAQPNIVDLDQCSAMEITDLNIAEAEYKKDDLQIETFNRIRLILSNHNFKANPDRFLWCSIAWWFKSQIVRKKVLERAIRDSSRNTLALKNGVTPLIYAIEHWHAERDILLEIISILKSRNLQINMRDSEGRTALLVACILIQNEKEEDAEAIIRALIKAGAKPNLSDKRGITPLMIAARNSWPSVVRLLLSHGANVNAQDPWGWTAIFYAWQGCSDATFHVLRKAQADIHHIDKSGLNVLDHDSACGEGMAMPEDELRMTGVKASPNKALLEFMHIVERDTPESQENYAAFQRILDQSNKKFLKNDRNLILFRASHPKVIEMLLNAGMNPNNQDHEGNTALMDYLKVCTRSVHKNCSEDNLLTVIKLFLRAGYDRRITNANGENIHAIAVETFRVNRYDSRHLESIL